jgi:sucrose-6-phosphate hydrolase SacC (GH32 family)
MIKFFRKIRQNLLTENKFSKYFLYAIGEIVLVVIGILIALQINNTNELSKQNRLVETYENSLISELKIDLTTIKRYDSISTAFRIRHLDYLNYYRKPQRDLTILNQKMDSIKNMGVSKLSSSAYTIDDLISTGNLSLFTKEKKEAILKVKNILDFYDVAYAEENQKLNLTTLEFQNAIDLTTFMGSKYTGINSEDDKLEDWRYNLESEQYRLFGNQAHATLRNCNFQIALLKAIKKQSENLLTILENDGKNK